MQVGTDFLKCTIKKNVLVDSLSISGTYTVTRHLQPHHPEQWAAYKAEVEDTALVRGEKSKEEQDRDESQTGTVRLYNVSTSGGRQSFLKQVGCWINLICLLQDFLNF